MLKIVYLLGLIALTTSMAIKKASPATTVAPQPPAGCVWVYENCGYSGKRADFCSDNDDFGKVHFNVNKLQAKLEFSFNFINFYQLYN